MESSLETIIDLLSNLSNGGETGQRGTDVSSHIRAAINTLRVDKDIFLGQDAEDIQNKAESLWNFISRQREDQGTRPMDQVVAAHARALVFWVLSSIRHDKWLQFRPGAVLIAIGTSAAADCSQNWHWELAQQILERTAEHRRQLKDPEGGWTNESEAKVVELDFRYHFSRLSLACVEGKDDLAFMVWDKALESKASLPDETIGLLVELGLTTARNRLRNSKWLRAIEWSALVINSLSKVKLVPQDKRERMRLRAAEIWIRALGARNTNDDAAKARAMLVVLQKVHHCDKLAVFEIHLDFLTQLSNSDVTEYKTVFEQILETVPLIDSTFNRFMWRAHTLFEHDPSGTCQILDRHIENRIQDTENSRSWRWEFLLTRVIFATKRRHDPDSVDRLLVLFQTVWPVLGSAFPPNDSSVVQMYIWKAVHQCYKAQDFRMAAAWCHVYRNRLIDAKENLEVVDRKLLRCLLEQRRFDEMEEVLIRESERSCQTEYASIFKFFQAARAQDAAAMGLCLNTLVFNLRCPLQTILSCVLAAASEKSSIALMWTMDMVIILRGSGALKGAWVLECQDLALRALLHWPTSSDLVQTCCKNRFHILADIAESVWSRAIQVSVERLVSYARLCFQTMVRCDDWMDSGSIKFALRVFTQFTDKARLDSGSEMAGSFARAHATCVWIVVRRCVRDIYEGLSPEVKKTLHIEVRKYTSLFKSCYFSLLTYEVPETVVQLDDIRERVLIWDFSSMLALEEWDDAAKAVREAIEDGLLKVLPVYAGGLLAKPAPAQMTFECLQEIMHASVRPDDFETLARWYHVLYELTCDLKLDDTKAILQQINETLERSNCMYPQNELSWLAIHLFNRALDEYVAYNEEACHQMMRDALHLAKQMEDDGQLTRELHLKMLLLEQELFDMDPFE